MDFADGKGDSDGIRRRSLRVEQNPRRTASNSAQEPVPSSLTRMVQSIFAFVRYAEFEILFVLFFLAAYLVFKDLTSRPEYNDILVKKPGGTNWWPY